MEIRAATDGDAPGMADLFRSAGSSITPYALTDRLAAIRQGPGLVLLATAWGPPSGLIAVHWHDTLLAPQPVAQIGLLLVGEEDRRRGVGRLLLKAAAQAARSAGCGALEMNVGAEQPSLQGFCQASGFTQAGAAFVRPLRKGG